MSFTRRYYAHALEQAVEDACKTNNILPALSIADQVLKLRMVPAINSRGMMVQLVADRMTLFAGYDLVTEPGPFQPIREELIRLGECTASDVARHIDGILLGFGIQFGFLDERQWDRVRDAIVRDNLGDPNKMLGCVKRLSLPATGDTTRRASSIFMGNVASDWL